MSFNRKTVDERNPTARGMSCIGPVAGFEQDRLKQSDFNHFAGDTVTNGFDLARCKADFEGLEISDKTKNRVLHDNALEFFGL